MKIAPDVASRLGRVPSTNQKALDLFYEAQTLNAKQTFPFRDRDSDYNKIQGLCTQAIALDSLFADAIVLKARTYWGRQSWNAFRVKPKTSEFLDSIDRPCERALAIDSNAVDAMVLLSDYNQNARGNPEVAFHYLEKANAINPNNAEVNLRLSGS